MIQSGQVEIVEGGIVQPDEATTNYKDVLRNFEAGHDWLMEIFGIKPKVAWQLDPWGHSSAQAQIFAELGMESVYFARMNKWFKAAMQQRRSLEFIWQPTFVDGDHGVHREILAHCHYTHYNPMGSLNFMDRQVFSDGIDFSEEDAQAVVDDFMKMFQTYEDVYRTDNILVMWGDDWAHKDAVKTYGAAEKIIKAIQAKMS